MGLILAQNLKSKRKELGLTQQLMSDLLNIERSTYAYYETGKTMPSLDTLEKISAVFNCSIEELIKNKTDLVVAEEPSFSLKKEDPVEPIKVAKRLIAKIVALPLKERIEVERIVDKMLADLENE